MSRALVGFFLASALLTACGSDGDGSGDGGTGGAPGSATDRCGLDITISGDATLELDFDDILTCATAYTLTPGAQVYYGPTPVRDIGAVEFSFPELVPGQTATALSLPTTIHHADRTQFSPTGCVADITGNDFSETTEAGDIYRVAGEGSCSGPGVSGDRTVTVVGNFRFIAGIRWQN